MKHNFQMTSVTFNDKKLVRYTYDERDNLVSITDPAGYTTSYGYNAQWLPETITDTYNTTATTPWRKSKT